MKYLYSIVVCLLLHFTLCAQGGVNFRPLSFQQALEASQREDRLLFIDCSTSWCGACKQMFHQIFPQKAAGDYFNSRFICLKFDMEKGEGPMLARKYGIQAYPTFLILRSDGSLVYKLVGGDDLEPFVERIERGLSEKNSLASLETLYRSGKADNKALMQYYLTLSDAGNAEEAERIHGELAGRLTETEKMQSFFWPFFAGAEYGTPEFEFILGHEDEMCRNTGKAVVEDKIFDVFVWAISSLMYGNPDNPDIKTVKTAADNWRNESGSLLDMYYEMALATVNADVDKLVSLLDDNIGRLENRYLFTVLLAFQKTREKRLAKVEYAKLASFCQRLLPLLKYADNREKLTGWYNMFAYRSATEVFFQDSDLETALSESRIYNNYTLVYCHDPKDCLGPSAKVLADGEVGDYINNNFRSIKIDMTGGKGREICTGYKVGRFPTLLVLDDDGSEIFRLEDWRTAGQLLSGLQAGMKGLKKRCSAY